MAFRMWKHKNNSLIQYIAFTTLHHLMKNYLQDSEAQQYFNPYMQIYTGNVIVSHQNGSN